MWSMFSKWTNSIPTSWNDPQDDSKTNTSSVVENSQPITKHAISEEWHVLKRSSSDSSDYELLNVEEPNNDVAFEPTSVSTPLKTTKPQEPVGTKRARHKKKRRESSVPQTFALKRKKTERNLRKQEKIRRLKLEQPTIMPAAVERNAVLVRRQQGGVLARLAQAGIYVPRRLRSMAKLEVARTKPVAPSRSYRKFRYDKEFKIPEREKRSPARSKQNFPSLKHTRKL